MEEKDNGSYTILRYERCETDGKKEEVKRLVLILAFEWCSILMTMSVGTVINRTLKAGVYFDVGGVHNVRRVCPFSSLSRYIYI